MQRVEDYHRFCPIEPQILISDAVCLGRRRASYPYCKGCQFNDDERDGGKKLWWHGAGDVIEQRALMIEKVFKAYDVRAKYPDPLDEDVAWRIGLATASFLGNTIRGMERTQPGATAIVVGRDMRTSSPSLSEALVDGMQSCGCPVIDIGMIDTPQIYFAINHLGTCGGVQTTASHNPADYNGFKISGRKGSPIGSDTGLADICRIAQNSARRETGEQAEVTQRDLSQEYRAFVRSFLESPRPLRICVDASNGMAGKWVPIVLNDVPGLELICMNMAHDGTFVHEPNPLVEANLAELRASVRANHADFGVCFDGDADRCILVDEDANIVRCDLLTALLARRFVERNPGSTVVYDLRSSRVVAEEVKAAGGVPRRERVGHAFIKKALSDSKGVFGGELSGHFYFKDNYYCDSALIALVQVINVLSREQRSLGELLAPLQRYHGSGERNFENAQQDATIQALGERYRDARIDYLDGVTVQYDDWWFNVRKSNTEPLLRLNVEASTADQLADRLEELAPLLGEPVAH